MLVQRSPDNRSRFNMKLTGSWSCTPIFVVAERDSYAGTDTFHIIHTWMEKPAPLRRFRTLCGSMRGSIFTRTFQKEPYEMLYPRSMLYPIYEVLHGNLIGRSQLSLAMAKRSMHKPTYHMFRL